jgi:hypothetical protein
MQNPKMKVTEDIAISEPFKNSAWGISRRGVSLSVGFLIVKNTF